MTDADPPSAPSAPPAPAAPSAEGAPIERRICNALRTAPSTLALLAINVLVFVIGERHVLAGKEGMRVAPRGI
jgi:hypothetical protein